jgi:CDP-glucose 4,6-dehydratase
MKYLLTGHSGFKGSWFSLWLSLLGHQVYGLSLRPSDKSLFNILDISKIVSKNYFEDIRDVRKVNNIFNKVKPEVVVHFAAQPLVLDSYKFPSDTFTTNVNGTLNVLRESYLQESTKLILIITTDKVYKNIGIQKKYVESDELKGKDPYSASKSMADILSQSWGVSFQGPPIAIARAGNVIGGGDFSPNRLIPDIASAVFNRTNLSIRNPDAVRPWQHIFDCLNGYSKLLLHTLDTGVGDIWNFGPQSNSFKKVSDVLIEIEKNYPDLAITTLNQPTLHEDKTLLLDSSKSESELQWKNLFSFEESISQTMNWYEVYYKNKDILDLSLLHLENYLELVSKS